MAINIPQVPFKMSTGVPDIFGSIAKGQQIPFNYENMIRAVLENQKSKKLLPFIEPTAKAGLEKLQEDIQKEQLMRSIAENYLRNQGQTTGLNTSPYNQGGNIPYGQNNQEISGSSEYGGNVPKSYVDQNISANHGSYVPGWEQPQAQQSGTMQQPSINSMSPSNVLGEGLTQKYLGIPGSPSYQNIGGTLYRISPLGSVTPVIQGPTPSQEAFEKSVGETRGKSYAEDVETHRSMQNQNIALDKMISSLDNPEFYNVVGPVQSTLVKWGAGSPEQQQLLGQLQSTSGEIKLQIAPSLKGAFTGRDQVMIDTVKADPNKDFPDVFIGKLKAQRLINEVLDRRTERSAQYKLQGIDPISADKKAAKEIPLSSVEPMIDRLIHPKTNPLITEENIKKTAQKRGKTVEQIKEELRGRGYYVPK